MISNREILDKRSKEGELSRKIEENTKKQQSTLAEKHLPSIQTLLASSQPSLLDNSEKLRAIAKTLLDTIDFNDDLLVGEILTFANSPCLTVKQNLLSKIQLKSEKLCRNLGEKAASDPTYQILNSIPALLLLNERYNNLLDRSLKRPLTAPSNITSAKKTKQANLIGTKESPIPLHIEEDKKHTEDSRTEDRQPGGVLVITSNEKIFRPQQLPAPTIPPFNIQKLLTPPSQSLLDKSRKELTEIAKTLDDNSNFYNKVFTHNLLKFTNTPNLHSKCDLVSAIRTMTRKLYEKHKNNVINDPVYQTLILIAPLLENLCPNTNDDSLTQTLTAYSPSSNKSFFNERAQQIAPSSMAPFATTFKPTPLDGLKQQLIQKSKILTEHLDNILNQNSNNNILSSAEEKLVESIHDYIKQIETTELSSSFVAKGLIRRTHTYLREIDKSPLAKFKPLKPVLNNIKTILLSFINFASQDLNHNNNNPDQNNDFNNRWI